MSREIKFRSWDGHEMHYESEQTIRWHYQDSDMCEAIMQFTGLLDKNGVEIYEGDILDSKYGIVTLSYERYITINGTYSSGFVFTNKKHGAWPNFPGPIEVIGNIYENPELIKGNS